MRALLRLANFRGELFSSTITTAIAAVIRLASSLVLTRLLAPEAYGIFAIMLSIVFVLELLSDVGTTALIVRHERGMEPAFVHTVWTIRLIRGVINFGILYAFAPQIAAIYDAPVLTESLRVFSFQFLFGGMESMGFILAQRDQRARVRNYADLATNALMTVIVIALATVLRNQFALIYGLLLQRVMIVAWSHLYYRHIGVGIAFDKKALADTFAFSRVVLPSSMLTIVLSQYDKVVLLKLFDLTVLGVYGVATNMVAPVTALITKNSQVVLYARCAEYFRADPATAADRYYAENRRLFQIGTLLPAAVAGLGPLLVAILYDARYSAAGMILLVLALAQVVVSFQEASVNLLVACGRTYVNLGANIARVCFVVPATLLGFYLFGFNGFLWFSLGAQFFVLGYLFWEQRRSGMLRWRSELEQFASAMAVFAALFALGSLILYVVPPGWLHLSLKKH